MFASKDDVTRYLRAKGSDQNINDWQFKPCVDAFEIYFVDVLQPSWGAEFDWTYWRSAFQGLRLDHPTLARETSAGHADSGASLRSVPLHANYRSSIQALIEAIRLRHFSIRTEQTYAHWVERLLRHVTLTDIALVGEAELEGFLSDLALRRNVSSSTQNLALRSIVFSFVRFCSAPLWVWSSPELNACVICRRSCLL